MSIGIPRIKDKNSEVITAEKALAINDAYYQWLDGTVTAYDVLLPPEAQGAECVIMNDAAATSVLTIKDDSDTDTIATLAVTEGALFVCNGAEWTVAGVPKT